MRVLFVVLSPLTDELGASQIALNLARALNERGIETELWSPHPVPAEVPWWRRMSWTRERVRQHLQENGGFDVVDVPPVAATAAAGNGRFVIGRSVQPDLLYLWTEWRHARRLRKVSLIRWLVEGMYYFYLMCLVISGWYKADRILCLGKGELKWMKRWFPWWREKTGMYVSALAEDERRLLAAIRSTRKSDPQLGTRFLWIGRWVAHKGVIPLLDFISQREKQAPTDNFTIAGCGHDVAAHVDSRILRSGRVRVVPSYTRRELMELLATHDAGLFTSVVEGWGLTLQEMLESGINYMIFVAVQLRTRVPR